MDKRNTQLRLKQAFIQLYQQKNIDKITIKEITDLAQVNRGTFYSYYNDIYDFKGKVEDELIETVKQNILPLWMQELSNNGSEVVLPEDAFYDQMLESGFVVLFLSERAEPQAIQKLKSVIAAMIIEYLRLDGRVIEKQAHFEYILEYISSAQLNIISLWFRNNRNIPIKELGNLAINLNLKGPIGMFQEYLRITE